MIITTNQIQGYMRDWLCSHIGYLPTRDMVCIGNSFDNELRAVVGFDNYNGSSIQIHLYGEGNCITKDFLRAVLHYAFHVATVHVILGIISSDKHRAKDFVMHLGFKVEACIERGHPNGDLLFMSMTEEDCTFLMPKQKQKQLELNYASI